VGTAHAAMQRLSLLSPPTLLSCIGLPYCHADSIKLFTNMSHWPTWARSYCPRAFQDGCCGYGMLRGAVARSGKKSHDL